MKTRLAIAALACASVAGVYAQGDYMASMGVFGGGSAQASGTALEREAAETAGNPLKMSVSLDTFVKKHLRRVRSMYGIEGGSLVPIAVYREDGGRIVVKPSEPSGTHKIKTVQNLGEGL